MSNQKKLEWILRIGVFGQFFGQGILAIFLEKTAWISWITQLTGLSEETATALLLVIGTVDILLAIIILIKPTKFATLSKPILLWLALWAFLFALVRPFVGLSFWDFVHRFSNWAAPLALYYFYHSRKEQ